MLKLLAGLLLFGAAALRAGEIRITTEHCESPQPGSAFRLTNAPPPSRNDAATTARFALVDGTADVNGGSLSALHDGMLPAAADEPEANFFFRAGGAGGRIAVDLGSVMDLKAVNTYSWHPGSRGPQLYDLYASDGSAPGFAPSPARPANPAESGWTLLARVDTRTRPGAPGGLHAVSVADASGSLGRYRFVLLDARPTAPNDPFAQTFFSEIDLVQRNAPVDSLPATVATNQAFACAGGRYQIALDTAAAPDLKLWTETNLVPALQTWYPKMADLLPSDGFTPPARVTVRFRSGMQGTPASTAGDRISCNVDWFRNNLQGEAAGCVIHELVHVIQQYPGPRNGYSKPGWLTEGIADYLRWFQFEPESRGAAISRRNADRARYDGGYRISANFLDWVSKTCGPTVVPRLNAALRQGVYREALWQELTGKTVQELGELWRQSLSK